jgi:molybdopterin-guanine dinucleotide biosynthesis protein A
MNTTAIVLAGGKGSRMNYAEKAWMLHQGKPLLSHVVDSIRPQVDLILISRNNTNDPTPALQTSRLTLMIMTVKRLNNKVRSPGSAPVHDT